MARMSMAALVPRYNRRDAGFADARSLTPAVRKRTARSPHDRGGPDLENPGHALPPSAVRSTTAAGCRIGAKRRHSPRSQLPRDDVEDVPVLRLPERCLSVLLDFVKALQL